MKNLVIIPTYNEIDNIENIISAVFALNVAFDLLIVDDGSPDGTAEKVKELQKIYPDKLFMIQRKGKLGLGTAYITGFKYAIANSYELVYEMDADFSHNPQDLIKLCKACSEDGNDMAIGSRYATGVNVVNWPMSRVLLSYFASVYVRFITGMPIQDTTAGFKCYRIEVLKTINLDKIRFVGYAFQIEMKFETFMFGFKIKEVPIIFTDRTLGESKMSKSIFREALLGIIEIKIASYFKNYIRN